jgi:hypothetical protein
MFIVTRLFIILGGAVNLGGPVNLGGRQPRRSRILPPAT